LNHYDMNKERNYVKKLFKNSSKKYHKK
jgi:hypothetical protein